MMNGGFDHWHWGFGFGHWGIGVLIWVLAVVGIVALVRISMRK